MNTRSVLKTFILIYSEAIWLFFGLAFYAQIEWGISDLPLPTIWVLACLAGYFSQLFMQRWHLHYKIRISLNLALLVGISVLHWYRFSAYAFSYKTMLILAGIFLYLRSANFFSKEPTRAQMLLRFEGNVLWYIVFVLILKVHPLLENFIHVPFMVAILMGLVGMTLTLDSGSREIQAMQTRIAGSYGGMLVMILPLLMLGSSVTLFLLVKPVQKSLQAIVYGIWERIEFCGVLILEALRWIFSLSPPQTSGTKLLQEPIPPSLKVLEAEAITYMDLPVYWIFLALSLLTFFVALVYLSKMRFNVAAIHTASINISALNIMKYWLKIWQRFVLMLKHLGLRWYRNFPGFYPRRIYWDFYLLQKWGTKVGIARKPQETPLDYGQRLISGAALPTDYCFGGQEYNLRNSVLDLVSYYASVYYGGKGEGQEKDFKPLLDYFKNTSFKAMGVNRRF